MKEMVIGHPSELLFSREILRLFAGEEQEKGRDERRPAGRFLTATHHMARLSGLLENDPEAMEVLKAFNLVHIIDNSYWARLSERLFARDMPPPIALQEHMSMTVEAWRMMIESAAPWGALTTPSELLDARLPDDIMSIELRYDGGETSLTRLHSTAGLLEKAYAAVARIYGKEHDVKAQLRIVSIQSGSAIRIDCKGLAEIVKHLKEFFFEAWHKLRHRRAEEVIEKNHAVLSTLAVMEKLESRKRDGSLSPEEAEQLRRSMISATLGMFRYGALPTDIPPIEYVDNNKLLGGFTGQKLLMPPALPTPLEETSASIEAAPKKTRRRRKKHIRGLGSEPQPEETPS